MVGVEELRRGHGGGGESGRGDPSVSAPKIARFCEEYLELVGRLVASRLMLELSPFMDSSVVGTAAAPTGSTRAELVATRRKLDEVKGLLCSRRSVSLFACRALILIITLQPKMVVSGSSSSYLLSLLVPHCTDMYD